MMGFGKNVYKLIMRGNNDHPKGTTKEVMPNKIEIDFDMLGLLVKDIITSHLNETSIIKSKLHIILEITIQIFKF